MKINFTSKKFQENGEQQSDSYVIRSTISFPASNVTTVSQATQGMYHKFKNTREKATP